MAWFSRQRSRAPGGAAYVSAILETVGDAVIVIGRDQRIRLINREAERIFGHPREQLVGEMVHRIIPERYRGRHPPALREACVRSTPG